MRRRDDLWYLLAAVWASSTSRGLCNKSLVGCAQKHVAVLDLDVLFKDEAQGRPACYPFTLMVTPSNGRVYVTNNLTKDTAPHVAGSHAAGWFIAEALRQSENYTPHIDQADIVFVNDYCYWAWWLAWLNFGTLASVRTQVDDQTPGDFLVSAYEKMMQTPRWQAHKGADFVFFDGHPGFYEGSAKHQIWPLRCGALQNAIQVVVGTPQRRRCSGFKTLRDRLIIAPLMAPIVDPHDEHIYTHDLAIFFDRSRAELESQSLPVPLKEREMLLYFKGRCDPHSKNHLGRLMRNQMGRQAFKDAAEDVHVTCLEDEVSQAAELLEIAAGYNEMRNAKFCLTLPDQEQATSAVAEAYQAGCIPVFVGPPWHSMPLAGTVAYNTSAVFIKLEDTSMFFDQTGGAADSDAHIGAHPQEAQRWSPDIPAHDLQPILITLGTPEEIVAELRRLVKDADRIEALARGVWREREKFLYHSAGENMPGAVQAIMGEACSRSQGRKKVDWSEGTFPRDWDSGSGPSTSH